MHKKIRGGEERRVKTFDQAGCMQGREGRETCSGIPNSNSRISKFQKKIKLHKENANDTHGSMTHDVDAATTHPRTMKTPFPLLPYTSSISSLPSSSHSSPPQQAQLVSSL